MCPIRLWTSTPSKKHSPSLSYCQTLAAILIWCLLMESALLEASWCSRIHWMSKDTRWKKKRMIVSTVIYSCSGHSREKLMVRMQQIQQLAMTPEMASPQSRPTYAALQANTLSETSPCLARFLLSMSSRQAPKRRISLLNSTGIRNWSMNFRGHSWLKVRETLTCLLKTARCSISSR